MTLLSGERDEALEISDLELISCYNACELCNFWGIQGKMYKVAVNEINLILAMLLWEIAKCTSQSQLQDIIAQYL